MTVRPAAMRLQAVRPRWMATRRCWSGNGSPLRIFHRSGEPFPLQHLRVAIHRGRGGRRAGAGRTACRRIAAGRTVIYGPFMDQGTANRRDVLKHLAGKGRITEHVAAKSFSHALLRDGVPDAHHGELEETHARWRQQLLLVSRAPTHQVQADTPCLLSTSDPPDDLLGVD